MEKDARQLNGEWKLNKAWSTPANTFSSSRIKDLAEWKLRFHHDSFALDDGSAQWKGTFWQSSNELHLHFKDTAGQNIKVWMLYAFSVTNRNLDFFRLEDGTEYHYRFRKVKD
ncbi:MAG: hypothetical protein JNL57_08420 [Bacteroidetes bacterium]|nr:hypothetical protein [Bacteroidota bacterium]